MTSLVHNLHNLGNYIVPDIVRGGSCVDIGGNTGAFSLKYSSHFREIHVYEPQLECNQLIRSRLEHYKHIHVYNEAVYSESGLQLNMIRHSNNDSGSVSMSSPELTDGLLNRGWTSDVVNPATTICLEDILERIGGEIDYCKIDCENGEYGLLMNKDLSKIKFLGIELHWQMGKDKYDELLNYIGKFFNQAIPGDISWTYDMNKETLFVSKTL